MINIKNKTEERLVFQFLKDTKEILDKTKIKYWLDWGTLLGAVRDKKIIEGDSDIDISTFSESWDKFNSILFEFEKKGFEIIDVSNVKIDKGLSYQKIFFSRSGLYLDIWFYQLKNETFIYPMMNCINRTSKALNLLYRLFSNKSSIYSNSISGKIIKKIKSNLYFIPQRLKKSLSKKIMELLKRFSQVNLVIISKHYFIKLEKIKFYGLEFNMPSDSKNYLKFKYGKGWNIHNKNFNKEGMEDYEDTLRLH